MHDLSLLYGEKYYYSDSNELVFRPQTGQQVSQIIKMKQVLVNSKVMSGSDFDENQLSSVPIFLIWICQWKDKIFPIPIYIPHNFAVAQCTMGFPSTKTNCWAFGYKRFSLSHFLPKITATRKLHCNIQFCALQHQNVAEEICDIIKSI